jgi:RNA recognition motif-containing protein
MPVIRSSSSNVHNRVVMNNDAPYNRTELPTNRTVTVSANNTRVYVGNLSWESTWQSLKDHMSTAGSVVRADILTDPVTKRSKGYGLVEYESAQEATNAINSLHSSMLDGRQIFVREDRESPRAPAMHYNPPPNSYNSMVPQPIMHPHGYNTMPQMMQPSMPMSMALQHHHHPIIPPHIMHPPMFNPPPMFDNRIAGMEPMVGRKIYVGNLSWEATWQDLKDHCKRVGHVLRAEIVMDATTNRSKGYGLVEYATVDDARKAIMTLNNTEIKGRAIFVREDRVFLQEFDESARRVYVGNLSWNTKWQDLKDCFKQVGPVARAEIVMDEVENKSKGYGIVEFTCVEHARMAIERFNNYMLDNRSLFVREDRVVDNKRKK